MGCLAILVYLGATVWVWTSFGVVPGMLSGVTGFVALNIIGPRLDARFGDRSQRFLEFHQAWDSLIGAPDTPEGLSAKRLWLAEWRAATRKSGVSAHDFLLAEVGEPRSQSRELIEAAHLDRMDQARAIAAASGDGWPGRDVLGQPTIDAALVFWDEAADRWRNGRLHASLTPGMLTPEPHLLVRVEDEAGGVVFRGESATWLVDRLDLDYRVPAHELRSAPWDAVTSASVPQRLAFVMRDTGIEALSAFLDEFGPDTSLWLEVEPAEWGRIAPSDDPLT